MGAKISDFIPGEFRQPSSEFAESMRTMELHWWYLNLGEGKCMISPKLRELFGIMNEENELPVAEIQDRIHPDDIALHGEDFRRLGMGELNIFECELRIKVLDSWRWFYVRGSVPSSMPDKPVIAGGITMDISERFNALIGRVDESRKFEFIFRQTRQPIMILEIEDGSKQTNIIEINNAVQESFGYTLEEINERDPFNFSRTETTRKKNRLNKLVEEGSDTFNTTIITRTGDQRFLQVNMHSFSQSGRKLIIAIITDHTESEVYREELEASEIRFKSIFTHTSIGVFLTGIDGSIAQLNPAAAKIIDIPVADATGKQISDCLRMNMKLIMDCIEQATNGMGKITEFENEVDFGGERKWIRVNISAISLPSGQVKYVLFLVENITDRRKTELALRHSERLYRNLIQSADDRIGLFNMQGEPVIVNTAFTENLGYSFEEYFGKDEMYHIHPADRKMLVSKREEFIRNGVLSVEYRSRNKDGEYRHMSSKSVLIKDTHGGEDLILYIIRDITSRIKGERELRLAKEQAEESDKLKSAFLANISHEIRTPMNSIVGFANLLSDISLDNESRNNYVERINRNSQHLLALIPDIIELAKIESNQLSINHSDISAARIIDELMVFTRQRLADSGKSENDISIRSELHEARPGKLVFRSDPIRISQVMQNIIDNAIKFTTSGSITIGVHQTDDASIRFYVADTGIGIEKDNFEIIFDEFRQIDGSKTRRFGGTGLGLAIARHLTSLLGGKIWVESVRDSGSTFYLEIPYNPSVAEQPEIDPDQQDNERQSPPISLLIVDNDTDSLNLLSTILRQEGMNITPARSGYKALQKIESSGPPDLVLLKLDMPVLSGYHTMKAMKDLYPGVRVIAHTGLSGKDQRKKYIEDGFDGFFTTPFDRTKILSEIASVIL